MSWNDPPTKLEWIVGSAIATLIIAAMVIFLPHM